MKSAAPLAPYALKYAQRLSLRLWSIHALRGLFLAAGAAAITVLLASTLAEPILTRSSAAWVWGAATLAGGLALLAALAPLRHYRGARIAQIVAGADPALAYRMRSALELADPLAAAPGVSGELLAAHINEVELELEVLPRRRLLPWSKLVHVSFLLGVLGLTLFAALSLQRPELRSFVRALVAPALERSDGTRIGRVVAQLRVRLVYPSYLGRDDSWLDDPREISAPAGTSLEFEIKPLFGAERGRLRQALETSPLVAAEDGKLRGRLAARIPGELHVEVEKSGVRYEDPRAIVLQVTPDQTPQISIEDPRNGTLAPPAEALSVRFVASDDVGLASVSLFARVAEGAEKQRQVFSAIDDGGPQRELRSGLELVPAELGAREGDTLVLWLEARDADLVSGPHVGKSREITLEVAQPGRGLSELIPSLQHIADTAVEVLGDRLENSVPKESSPAKARFSALERNARAWLGQIDAVNKHAERGSGGSALDLDQLRGVRRRNDLLLNQEAVLHSGTARSFGDRNQADARQVDELERDVILLSDMLARAHVDEAKAIADELRELKRHIERLLDQLGKSHSAEAERELMREIAKAQRRLAELAQSLSRMATRVPSEFVNREAVQKEAAESALTNLERAVQDHDLRAAAEHLDALAKQIDDLAAQLGQGGLRLQEARFGPRDQAMAQARQKLGMLSSEQNRLSERSGEVAQNALERAQGSQSDARARGLAPQAEALEKSASELARRPGSGWQSPAAGRAVERLRDTRDALRAGDLSEARGMAESAERSLREAAGELDSEARMFPGHRGETAQRAADAHRAAEDAERLSQAIDRAMPEVSGHVNDAERQRMRNDADSQRKMGQATEDLKQAFEKGPDGLPLSPDAVDSLDSAREAMQRAQRALERGKPDEAHREQKQAGDRLQKLSQSLAEKQSGSARRQQGRNEGESGEMMRDAPVHIPGAEEWKGPTELRRKLLDAMHEGGPSGYEAAIQRYYQELMR